MNRYSRYDEDSYRLPEGMTRVGYDADEQKYIFRDRSGNEWASRSGEAYGKLERIGWDGGRLLKTSPTFSSGKAPATDFSEIIGADDDKASTGDPTKKKRRLNPFLLLSPILTMRSKMKARRDSNASASTMRSPTSTISTVDSERSPTSPN
ncbi:uncharacterized protein J3D65DRAFT_380980 [Phyllosticta citribraziliensis]|uniref:Uncharacterized protein n=1 Tax=Phyllosticta citribraziliensis TaxID=989973 RepID=A0ABR1LQH0_9PEZI